MSGEPGFDGKNNGGFHYGLGGKVGRLKLEGPSRPSILDREA
jgi:hypothetical protein